MRVKAKGVDSYGPSCTFEFNEKKLEGVVGDSIASALINSGEYGLRNTEGSEKRGLFCGMGVCNECIVKVNGEEGLLACMTPLKPNMEITNQEQHISKPNFETEPELDQLPEISLSPDVLVIGGGPAGLSVAAKLGSAGKQVLLIDERKASGGQYFKQPASDFEISEEKLDSQYRKGKALIRKFEASGAKSIFNMKIWGVFGPEKILGYDSSNCYVITPKHVVIATGAFERGLVFPGWTLPGVLTTGAGQSLLRSYQVSPGNRVAIAGNGPLNMQLAAELIRAGVDVAALAESAKLFKLKNLILGGLLFLRSPKLALTGVGYLFTIAKAKTKILPGYVVARVDGEAAVETVEFKRLDKSNSRTFNIDAITIGYGFIPSNEIARLLGCAHEVDDRWKYLGAKKTLSGSTSVPNVWIAGDGSGINGAQVAQSSGTLLAHALLAQDDAQKSLSDRVSKLVSYIQLRNQLGFQKVLRKIFSAPVLIDELAEEDTVVCRCLSISYAQVKAGISEDTLSAGASKRISRVGMGRCQGRYCSPVIQKLISENSGYDISERSGFAPQIPIKPVEIGVVAYAQERKNE
ncbi:MAG: FAD-dependent oxidoreductase [Actinomycetota bacterium]|nr:FAD-dependent oxidoreductase [Actinomycetota bacterium]